MSNAFEREFAAALLRPAAAADIADLPAFARQPAFAVYRNNIATACVDALRANYPTVLEIVGDAWFNAAATLFVQGGALPQDGRLCSYGAGWPAFLGVFEPTRELPYLAGVAQLDRFWTEAHLAADAPPLDAAELASMAPEQLAAVTLALHPAARWAWFAEAPVFTLWQRHREKADPGADVLWHGEGVLLSRPHGVVRWDGLDAATCGFLDACAAGASFGDAAALDERALRALPKLLAAGAFRGHGAHDGVQSDAANTLEPSSCLQP